MAKKKKVKQSNTTRTYYTFYNPTTSCGVLDDVREGLHAENECTTMSGLKEQIQTYVDDTGRDTNWYRPIKITIEVGEITEFPDLTHQDSDESVESIEWGH